MVDFRKELKKLNKEKMAKSLRDQLKATKVKKLQDQAQKEDKLTGGGGSRAGFLEISKGTNKFRLFPAHPNGTDEPDPFYQMKVTHWVSIEKEDGKMGRKSVFNAKVHGGAKKDIFEEYIEKAKKHLIENGIDGAAEKAKTITDWKEGIGHSNAWTAYALKIDGDDSQFGLLEFGKLVRDGFNEIASMEDDDEPIEVDPFTDPDDGMPVIVKYSPEKKVAKDKYSVTLGRKPEPLPLTDEQIDEFMSHDPLISKFSNVYSSRDFELACEGIRNFDEKNEIGFCDTDEWEELIESLNNTWESGDSEEDEDDSPVKSKKKSAPKKVTSKKAVAKEDDDEDEEEEEVEEDEEEMDKYDEMDRQKLKNLIKKESLNIRITSSKSDDMLREEIREAMDGVDEEEEDEEEEVPVKAKAKPVTKSKAGSISLSDIKAKLKGKK